MLPYLWDDLGGTTVGYGIMMSEFGALQLVGNLLSGGFCGAVASSPALASANLQAPCIATSLMYISHHGLLPLTQPLSCLLPVASLLH